MESRSIYVKPRAPRTSTLTSNSTRNFRTDRTDYTDRNRTSKYSENPPVKQREIRLKKDKLKQNEWSNDVDDLDLEEIELDNQPTPRRSKHNNSLFMSKSFLCEKTELQEMQADPFDTVTYEEMRASSKTYSDTLNDFMNRRHMKSNDNDKINRKFVERKRRDQRDYDNEDLEEFNSFGAMSHQTFATNKASSHEPEESLDVYPDIPEITTENETQITNDFNDEYFKNLLYDTVDFVQSPAPKGTLIKCKILVTKGIFNEFHFLIEDNFSGYLLLKTVRKKTIAQLNYSIQISNTAKPYKFGQLYSNKIRNSFILTGNYDEEDKLSERKYSEVRFLTNLIASMRPKDLTAEIKLLDKLEKDDQDSNRDTNSRLGDMFHRNSKNSIMLTTKKPIYDEKSKTYRLKFEGRVKAPSTNNIQLVEESNPDEILFQLGKIKTKCYSCDYSYPLCALNAFGIAVSCLSRS